jgi:TRAP-type C4-dicarboxylate transport system permease small subunit
MRKPLRIAIFLLVASTLVAGFVLSALQPSWWTTRQITFSWGDAHSSSAVTFTAPETWFNEYVLTIAAFLLFYFAVRIANRLYRERQRRISQTQERTSEQPHQGI